MKKYLLLLIFMAQATGCIENNPSVLKKIVSHIEQRLSQSAYTLTGIRLSGVTIALGASTLIMLGCRGVEDMPCTALNFLPARLFISAVIALYWMGFEEFILNDHIDELLRIGLDNE